MTEEKNQSKSALRDLVPFLQFKKRKKHPWRNVFSKVAGKPATLLKLTLLHECFSRFLNCKNGTKSRNAPNLARKTEDPNTQLTFTC